MAKKETKSANSRNEKFYKTLFTSLGKVIWFLIKIPYYIIKGLYLFIKFLIDGTKKVNVEIKRNSTKAVYQEFKLIKALEGDYTNWENKISEAESKIGIIIGARGSGKTAFGVKLLENIYARKGKKCYAIGFKKEDFPSWINIVDNIANINNNSFVLIDEGGILFSSRKSMSEANKFLSDLILVARHKNLNIIFISQNSSNLDVNILRQADYLVLKPSSLLQKEFERKIIRKIYDEVVDYFDEFKDEKGLTFIYNSDFKGFVSNPLPSFWNTNISKSFR